MWDHAVPARSSYLLYYPCPESPPPDPVHPTGAWRPWRLSIVEGAPPVLTYFQPSVVLQLSQKISATEWSPVSRRRCSAGPQPTLTLSQETGGTQYPVGSLCQSSPQTAQRNFHLES